MLETILITETLGLAVYAYVQENKSNVVFALYFILAIATLLRLVQLMNLRDNGKLAHKKSTITFAKNGVIVGTAILAITSFAWAADLLPSHDLIPCPLPLIHFIADKWDKPAFSTPSKKSEVAKGDEVIRAYASFAPSDVKGPIPDSVVVDATLSAALVHNSWEIVDFNVYLGDIDSDAPADFSRWTDEWTKNKLIGIIKSIDSKQHYTVRLLLHRIHSEGFKKESLNADELKIILKRSSIGGGPLIVKVHLPDKKEKEKS